MNFEINKEKFSSDDFKTKEYLNYLLGSSKENESSDILSFKLKIIQREFSNEIELNSNNVLKSSKTIGNDLKIVNQLQNLILDKVDKLMKGKQATFNTKAANELVQANNNITKDIFRQNVVKGFYLLLFVAFFTDTTSTVKTSVLYGFILPICLAP